MYDYIIEQYFDNYKLLYINIFDFLRKNTHTVISSMQSSKEDINEYINFNILSFDTKEDIVMMIKILSILTRSTILEVFRKRLTVEEGKEQMERQTKILQKGMMKK